ncbi:hypothetical protein DN069_32970 [Streptacidiphilus pinicola]|uniref:DUF2568 domain-containing protein n=1 Tax=Streptacidiphilus pinicola TaxID=2219663 RepID=A0A2X0I8X6_9ACTN|nr:YrdB family protein [Streptacidiphilus pinicola]RAG81392.1 hypothetical protein DN069_32970 [Streptacidiphilus pinicola]
MSAGTVLGGVSATLAFLLELAVYGCAGYWGLTRSALARPLRILLAVGALVLLVVVWALFGAPSAAYPLHGVGRAALELVWFGTGAAALFAAGRRRAGCWYLAAWALSTVLELTVR